MKAAKLGLLVGGLAVAAGCGDGDGEDGTAGTGGLAVGATGGAVATGGAAGAVTGSGGTGGTTGIGGASGGVGTGGESPFVPVSPVQELVPLIPGRVLTYSASALDPAAAMEPCDSFLGVFGEVAEYDGHTGVWYDSPCQTVAAIMVYEGNDVMLYGDALVGGVQAYAIAPLAETTEWSSFTWRPAGTVTVPAGTFSDCWNRIEVDEPTRFATFCPGVGMVVSNDPRRNRLLVLASL